jgi:protein TonB
MKRTVSLFEFMPYGAPELLDARESHLASALASASLLALAAFLVALPLTPLLRSLPSREPAIEPPNIIIDDFPTPTLVPPLPKKPSGPASSAASAGIVVPVPPAAAPPEDLEWADHAAGPPGPPASGASGEPEVRDPGPTAVEVIPVRGVHQDVDELPVPVMQFKPEYPSFARDAGIEGLVVVDVLIGTNGHVLRAERVGEYSVPMLDPTALEAARRWTFRPAISGGRAVPYWYRIPFRFVLHE